MTPKANQEEPLRLTLEQNEMVREALEAKKQGEASYSAEEVLTFTKAKVNACSQAKLSSNSPPLST